MKTMGGEVFWENIEESGGYRLQKNIVFGNKTKTKDTKKRNLQGNFTDEHRCKSPQQNTSKLHPTIH